MEQKDPLEGLSDQHKEDVQNFMMIAHIDSAQTARHYMDMCGFDLNQAMAVYMEHGGQGSNNNAEQMEEEVKQQQFNEPPPQQQHFNPYDQVQQQFDQQEMYNMLQQAARAQNVNEVQGVDQAQLEKYKKFLDNKKVLEQNNGVVKKVVSGIGSASKSVWNSLIPVNIRGETPGGEEFNQFIQKKLNIQLRQTYNFQVGSLQEVLDKGDVQKRPIMVFIYQDTSPAKDLQKQLLQNQEIKTELNKSFYSVGILFNSDEAKKLLKYVKSADWPAFAIFRKNIFEQNELLMSITISTHNPNPEFYLTKLKEARSQFYMKVSEDEKIRKAEKQQRRPQLNPFAMEEMAYYHTQQIYGGQAQNDPVRQQEEEQRRQRIEQERQLKEQQEREYQDVLKQSEEEERKRLEEIKRQEEEEARLAQEKQQYEESLQLKKSKIPDEPAAGDGVITVAFRLPDGSKIQRRFMLTDTPQVVFDFIETKDEVEFEGSDRKFDLIQTFPSLNLKDKMDQSLDEIFDGSDFEQLHVREL